MALTKANQPAEIVKLACGNSRALDGVYVLERMRHRAGSSAIILHFDRVPSRGF